MTKRKTNRSARHGLLALRHGPHHSTGTLLNVRHPKKFKLAPPEKKAPAEDATRDRCYCGEIVDANAHN